MFAFGGLEYEYPLLRLFLANAFEMSPGSRGYLVNTAKPKRQDASPDRFCWLAGGAWRCLGAQPKARDIAVSMSAWKGISITRREDLSFGVVGCVGADNGSCGNTGNPQPRDFGAFLGGEGGRSAPTPGHWPHPPVLQRSIGPWLTSQGPGRRSPQTSPANWPQHADT